MKKFYPEYGDDLKNFASSVDRQIKKNRNGTDQKAQVEELMLMEKRFLNSVWLYEKQMTEIYKRFILMVVKENRNILSARSYFREKSVFFNQYISPAIKEVKIKSFKKFKINFLMASFIRKNWVGIFPPKCEEFYQRLVQARTVLIENNLPLAINKAKSHFKKTKQVHLDLMDIINIASIGLADGIDKYVGNHSKVYVGVLIGRMTGDMIYESSQSFIHFYPSDKQIIYRANTLKNRYKIKDIETLTKAVNKSLEQDKKEGKKLVKYSVTVEELNRLMVASSMFSLDHKYSSSDVEDDGEGPTIADALDNEFSEETVEDVLVKKEAWSRIYSLLTDLDLIDKKIIRMKGVKL